MLLSDLLFFLVILTAIAIGVPYVMDLYRKNNETKYKVVCGALGIATVFTSTFAIRFLQLCNLQGLTHFIYIASLYAPALYFFSIKYIEENHIKSRTALLYGLTLTLLPYLYVVLEGLFMHLPITTCITVICILITLVCMYKRSK